MRGRPGATFGIGVIAATLVGLVACTPTRRQAPEDPAASGRRTVNLSATERAERKAVTDRDNRRFADAEAWAKKFESPDRDAWQQPQKVIALLQLPPGSRVADLGSATGYFPVRLARTPGVAMVYGLDVEPDLVRYLNERAQREGLTNLTSALIPVDEPALPEPVDLVLLVNTYHHIGGRIDYFRKLHAGLRPGGRLAVVDFRKGDWPVGPPDEHKVDATEVKTELTAAGYTLVAEWPDALPYQFVMVFAPAGAK